jgi:nitrogen fixation NifU-like protein
MSKQKPVAPFSAARHVGEMMESGSDFLQEHSLRFLEMALSADRQGTVRNPDGYGKNVGGCGDTVEFFLTVQNDRVQSVSYMVDGCINTNACANTVAHLTEGKTVHDAWAITPETVIDYLQTLPAEAAHCAELAVGAFYKALSNLGEIRRNPWKKNYQSY